MRRAVLAIALLAPLAAGCASPSRRPMAIVEAEVAVPPSAGWEAIATPEDRARIAALRTGWATARLGAGRRAARRIAAEGALLDPDAALDLPALSPGSYRCRLLRIGGRAGFASYAPDFCFVDGNANGVSFTKQTGQNLPGGWLHPDTDRRQIFLGTFRAESAASAPPYGVIAERDVAGVVERVGPFRWRLVLTKAGRGALLDVYELIPVIPGQPECRPPGRPGPR